jgi:hypothetical protein
MEPEGSLLCSQEPATCPYPESNESVKCWGFHKSHGISRLAERLSHYLLHEVRMFKMLVRHVTVVVTHSVVTMFTDETHRAYNTVNLLQKPAAHSTIYSSQFSLSGIVYRHNVYMFTSLSA